MNGRGRWMVLAGLVGCQAPTSPQAKPAPLDEDNVTVVDMGRGVQCTIGWSKPLPPGFTRYETRWQRRSGQLVTIGEGPAK